MSDYIKRREETRSTANAGPASASEYLRNRRVEGVTLHEVIISSELTDKVKADVILTIPNILLKNGLILNYNYLISRLPHYQLESIFQLFYERQVSVWFQDLRSFFQAYASDIHFPRIIGFDLDYGMSDFSRLLSHLESETKKPCQGLIFDMRSTSEDQPFYETDEEILDVEGEIEERILNDKIISSKQSSVPFGILLSETILCVYSEWLTKIFSMDSFDVFMFDPLFFENNNESSHLFQAISETPIIPGRQYIFPESAESALDAAPQQNQVPLVVEAGSSDEGYLKDDDANNSIEPTEKDHSIAD
jgi:hypothetical protein